MLQNVKRFKGHKHIWKTLYTNTDWQKNCKNEAALNILVPSRCSWYDTLHKHQSWDSLWICHLLQSQLDGNEDWFKHFPNLFWCNFFSLLASWDTVNICDNWNRRRASWTSIKCFARKTQTCAGTLQQMSFPLQWSQCRDNGQLHRSKD